ncbi:aspartate aminotransferase family protein [Micromonospora echinofusca]|uniref:Aminotransferase class III-fold pyridoxal phosphate-dependent enzyme n=1 Tax=Micromonospora echinofusca TaxID=47858 RepID=A0ABS3VQQ3_MICEH|nr:aspartate aminotransferase family protein [Micromonospora echinofusca]MBO4206719.1 aminotransferase class III-fold pyridoxal phosphate-dependent enzyme [Micromonospora echinofusca]
MTGAPDLARETFRRLRSHMSPALALSGRFAGRGAVEVAGDGCEVVLSDGRRALDFGSYAVTLLGHRHPDVVAAVAAQLGTMPVSTRSLANPVAAAAAEEVVGYLGGVLPRVYFGTNGADAVEVAVKLARLATGRRTVLAVRGAFHGKTMGALALTWHPRFRVGVEELLGGTVHVDPEDPDAVRAAAIGGDLAAVVFEPVQGENGVVPLDPEVLARWTADAHAAGAMVISDEIQVGLRRGGERSIALAAGLPVDAVLLGKPLGGGVVPVSAAVCAERLYRPLIEDSFRHSATFGGQPLAMAAVPVALRAIEEYADHGADLSARLAAGLADLHRRHPDVIAGVRGRGLIWGVDLASPEHAGEVTFGLIERGLLVSHCLSRPETLRLLPPIVAGTAEVQRALDALDGAVGYARTAVDAARSAPAAPGSVAAPAGAST